MQINNGKLYLSSIERCQNANSRPSLVIRGRLRMNPIDLGDTDFSSCATMRLTLVVLKYRNNHGTDHHDIWYTHLYTLMIKCNNFCHPLALPLVPLSSLSFNLIHWYWFYTKYG